MTKYMSCDMALNASSTLNIVWMIFSHVNKSLPKNDCTTTIDIKNIGLCQNCTLKKIQVSLEEAILQIIKCK